MNKYVFDSDVFTFAPSERQTVDWEIKSDREKRNAESMKKSYGELMSMGRFYVDEQNWTLAVEQFYYAKTLFPDRIAPRKYLCYGYLVLCQDDWRYCNRGKRELYYAMKYVSPTDQNNYNYLSEMVSIAGLDNVVKLEEGEALAAIY